MEAFGARNDDPRRVRVFVTDAPPHVSRISIDGLVIEIIDDDQSRLVRGPGRPQRLVPIDVGPRPVPVHGEPGRRLVYADRFSDADRDVLRERRWTGLDRTGGIVLCIDDLVVEVVSRGRSDHSIGPEPKNSVAVVRGRAAEVDDVGYGVASVRLCQTILDDPHAPWTTTSLARDGGASDATASRLLARLRRLGLAFSPDEGRERVHLIREPALVAEWLAKDVNRRPRQDMTVPGFLIAHSPFEVARLASQRLAGQGIDHAVTGAAAAQAEVPVVTAIPEVLVRIDPEVSSAEALRAVDASEGGRGANLRLVRDVGRLGVHGARETEGIKVAGRTRVWLDLRNQVRGESAADLYREYLDSTIWMGR